MLATLYTSPHIAVGIRNIELSRPKMDVAAKERLL